MGLFPQTFIDDLRLQANILQVVQEYVPLKKVGRTYKGLCPFHSEKTPSFHVDPEKGFFHCFGCSLAATSSSFSSFTKSSAFRTRSVCSPRRWALPCRSTARAALTMQAGVTPGCGKRS